MATATAILDRAARLTGLRTTGTERAMALEVLNSVYNRVILDSECHIVREEAVLSDASGAYELNVITSQDPLKVVSARIETSSGNVPLVQVGYGEMDEHIAQRDDTGDPAIYAVHSDQIFIFPSPAIGATLHISHVPVGTYLADNSTDAPSMVPSVFHFDVLLPGVVTELLDKDQRSNDVTFWNTRFQAGMARLMNHVGSQGGEANRAYRSY